MRKCKKQRKDIMNEKINDMKDRALNKADELYSKLPLDKINDKLGGKVDVKTKKFKLIAAVVLLVLIVLGGCLIFGGSGDSEMSEKERKFAKELLEKDFGMRRSLSNVKFVSKERDGGVAIRVFKGLSVSKSGEKVYFKIMIPKGNGVDYKQMRITTDSSSADIQ